MRKQLYQYVVLLHPEIVDGKEVGETELIVKPDTILAKSEKVAGLTIARAIPEEFVDKLDRAEIIIRPF